MKRPLCRRGWGLAWLGLTLALAVHVLDEATHDFLAVWNPAVEAMRRSLPLVPLPTFTFPIWLGGLAAAVVLLLFLSRFAFRGCGWMRPVSCALAVLMVGNALGHLAVSAALARPMPGVYSSPLLLAAAVHLLLKARAAAPAQSAAMNAI